VSGAGPNLRVASRITQGCIHTYARAAAHCGPGQYNLGLQHKRQALQRKVAGCARQQDARARGSMMQQDTAAGCMCSSIQSLDPAAVRCCLPGLGVPHQQSLGAHRVANHLHIDPLTSAAGWPTIRYSRYRVASLPSTHRANSHLLQGGLLSAHRVAFHPLHGPHSPALRPLCSARHAGLVLATPERALMRIGLGCSGHRHLVLNLEHCRLHLLLHVCMPGQQEEAPLAKLVEGASACCKQRWLRTHACVCGVYVCF